ncbi:hypothetical protein [Novosphingobium sp. 9U]|uniref:hypothetical protein n=1 Tax=Novosphingobium sp. 9U TaxID=2653158 RepID=UPI0012F44756|nr:hypothetical protein [Novosphingobium sp. 9U]VWX52962.1 hypothetical protein NOVOSPHI9U_420205 [Novosphingobium sp. 9U]
MSSKKRSALPPGTTAAAHRPRLPVSGWHAVQEALREQEERGRDGAGDDTRGADVVRVVR